jgi:putative oxidoreductase
MPYILLLGRTLFALIFLAATPGHFSEETIRQATTHGVPMASIAVPLAGILSLVGALSVIAGFKARWGALLLLVFLVPVTLTMHAFWTATDAAAATMQRAMFMKNISILGGALILIYFGAGPISVDAWLASRTKRQREHMVPASA